MLINLFDYNFRQAECSVAFQTPFNVRYVRDQTNWNGITLFTDGYLFDGTVNKVTSKRKIGWLREPRCLWPKHYEMAPTVVKDFDFILTYDADLLELPGFKFVPYGGIWINRKEWGLRHKSKLISMLYGEKRLTAGHKLRHEVADYCGDKCGIDYYGFRGTPTDYSAETKLKVLGDYMFSIVTETCREDNLFTEILLDCFAVGTIPIFWGAPNIGDFFDPQGIVTFVDLEDLNHKLHDYVNRDFYNRMMGRAVLDNHFRVRKYAITEDWMFDNGVFDDH